VAKIPDNAVALSRIEVMQYMDEHGEMKYATTWTIDQPLSTLLGLLELAKHDLLERHRDDIDVRDEP